MMERAKDLLWQLSAEPSAQELARQRELALITYRLEMSAAKEEGRAEALRAALTRVLQRRGLAPHAEQAALIEHCLDPEVLEGLLDRAVVATTVEEVFADE